MQSPTICCLQENHFQYNAKGRLKIKGLKKYANINQRKAGVFILIPEKVEFRAKRIKRSREVHYLMIKGLVHQEDNVVLNVYVPKNRAAIYVIQKLTELEGETIRVGDFNTPL